MELLPLSFVTYPKGQGTHSGEVLFFFAVESIRRTWHTMGCIQQICTRGTHGMETTYSTIVGESTWVITGKRAD